MNKNTTIDITDIDYIGKKQEFQSQSMILSVFISISKNCINVNILQNEKSILHPFGDAVTF